jgi:hypothetical protein
MSAAKDLDKSVRKPSQGILRPAEAALTGAFLIVIDGGIRPRSRRAVSAPAGGMAAAFFLTSRKAHGRKSALR